MEQLFPKIGTSQKLSQIIVEKIEDLIRNKKLVAGQKLPTEKELCEMFAVSRTSLREALQMLAAKGLITIRKGSGIYVNDYSSETARDFISFYLETNFDRDSVMHVIQVRQIIEPHIAKMAAENRSDADLLAIEKNLQEFGRCNKSNVKQLGKLDREFHLLLAESCGNPLVPVLIDPIFRLMPKIRTLVYAKIDHAESAALEFHRRIFEKIQQQDPDAAYAVMTEHLAIAEDHSQKILNNME